MERYSRCKLSVLSGQNGLQRKKVEISQKAVNLHQCNPCVLIVQSLSPLDGRREKHGAAAYV